MSLASMAGMGGANQIASLFVKVGADARQFESAMGGVERRLGVVGGAVTKLGAFAAAAAVGGIAAVGTGLTMALKSSAEFEKVMSGAGAVLGASNDQMERLNDLALQLGKDTSFSASQAASAIEMLAKNGVNAEQILGGMADATVALAAATGASLPTAADVATDAMMQFGLSTEQVKEAINGISGVVVNSKFDINDYALALSQGGGVAAKVGVSFEDFNTTIAAISSSFGSGSDAGTSFKTFLQRLVPQSDAASDSMRALGLFTGLTSDEYAKVQGKIVKYQTQLEALDPSSRNFAKQQAEITSQLSVLQSSLVTGQNAFFDTEGNMKSMSEVFGLLQNAFGGLSDEARISAMSTIFGTDAMRAAAAMADIGADKYNEIADAMSKVDAAGQAAKRLDNLAGDVEQLGGSFETLKIKLGQAFTPLARKGVQLLTEKLNELIDLDFDRFAEMAERGLNAIGGTISFVRNGVTSLVKGFQKMRGSVGGLLRPFAGPLKDLLTQFKTGFSLGFDKADFSGPVKGIFTGLVDMWLSAERWMLGTGLPALMTTLGRWGSALVEWIGPQVPGILAELGGMVGELVQWLGGSALPAIGRKLNEWGAAFVDWIEPQIPPLITKMGGLLRSVGNWITGTALPALTAKLTEWGAALVAWVAPQIPVLLAKMGELWKSVTSWITDGEKRTALVTKLGDWAGAFSDWAGGLWSVLLTKLSTFWTDSLLPWFTDGEKRTQLFTKLAEWGGAFSDWAGGIWGIVTGKLSAFWTDNLLPWFTEGEKQKKILSKLAEWGAAFTTWAGGIWTAINPKLTEMATSLKTWIDTNAPPLGTWIDAFLGFTSKVKTDFEAEWPKIESIFKTNGTAIAGHIQGIIDKLGQLAQWPGSDGVAMGVNFAKIFSGITTVVTAAALAVTSAIDALLSAVLTAFQAMEKLASGDVGGYLQTWKDGLSAIGDALAALQDTALGDISKWIDPLYWLGIRSESTGKSDGRTGNRSGASAEGMQASSASSGWVINVNVDPGTIPTDRSRLQELARAIWREAEMSGMRL